MAKKTEIAPLNSLERTTLRNAEKVVDNGKTTFLEVGNALKTIQDGKLYRETHKSFQAYVENRHNFGRAWAYKLIQSATVIANVSPAGDTSSLPTRQTQALAKLPEEQQAAAYQDAAEAAGGPPTTQQVEETVETYLADNEPYVEVEEPDEEAPWSPENDMVDAEPTTEERMIQAARALAALSRAIQAHSKEAEALNDPHLDDIRLQILKSQLRAAGGTLLACRGVQVCKCVRGCKSCRKSGWLTKDVAETMAE